MPTKKQPTKAEREHMAKVAALNCIICGHHAQVHHIRTGQGMGQRASHFDTIPLCPHHHQDGGYGEAIHSGSTIWQHTFGTELELLEKTRELLREKA